MQNLGLKKPFLKKFNLYRKIQILNTHNPLCRKFGMSARKLQLSAPRTFLTQDTANLENALSATTVA